MIKLRNIIYIMTYPILYEFKKFTKHPLIKKKNGIVEAFTVVTIALPVILIVGALIGATVLIRWINKKDDKVKYFRQEDYETDDDGMVILSPTRDDIKLFTKKQTKN